MTDAAIPQLIPVRTLQGSEPVIIQPYPLTSWASAKRIKPCELYALPDGAPDVCYAPEWWTPLLGRDVTLWPTDAWSGHVMTLIHVNLATARRLGHSPFRALRWAWGHPAADELGQPPAVVETLWCA